MARIKIVECPRDAWQGLATIIPTETKIAYLRKLLECGFHHVDAVSFVSPKHVPQMADSELVMEALYPDLAKPLDTVSLSGAGSAESPLDRPPLAKKAPADAADSGSSTPASPHAVIEPLTINEAEDPILGSARRPTPPEIIGIVVNEAGLERALKVPGLTTIGYPYSVSAHFRRANANMSKAESQALVGKLQKALSAPDAPVRNLVVYISMAFGNNYDEPWGPEIVIEAVEWLRGIGVRQVSLADTIGTASASAVSELYNSVKDALSNSASGSGSMPGHIPGWKAGLELGVHLHSLPEDAADKVLAAYEAGCRRFDSALTGLGGCPFAGDDLVGNIPTEIVVSTLSAKGVETGIEPWALLTAVKATKEMRKRFA